MVRTQLSIADIREPDREIGRLICENRSDTRGHAQERRGVEMKGADKPKKLAKKVAQKSLKEKRAAKKAAAKTGRLEA